MLLNLSNNQFLNFLQIISLLFFLFLNCSIFGLVLQLDSKLIFLLNYLYIWKRNPFNPTVHGIAESSFSWLPVIDNTTKLKIGLILFSFFQHNYTYTWTHEFFTLLYK